MASYNIPDSISIPSDDDNVEHVKLATARYNRAEETEASPRTTGTARTTRKRNNKQKMSCKTLSASKRPLRSGVMNLNEDSRIESPRRRARASPASEMFHARSHMAAPGATVYDQHEDVATSTTTSRPGDPVSWMDM